MVRMALDTLHGFLRQSKNTMRYKAFISYSHAVDGQLAPMLQSALHNFAKPWYRLRAIRLFRDRTNLAINPNLWSSIEQALREAEYFLLLASPEAAASAWVQREITSWLQHHSASHLLIMLTSGYIVWDKIIGDFDWSKTSALPRNLCGVFSEEPLYLDCRWARHVAHLSLRYPLFQAMVADLNASKRDLRSNEGVVYEVHLVCKVLWPNP